MPDSPDNLPDRLRAWRKRHGLSQSDAAARLRMSVRTLQNWEQAHQKPRGLAMQHLLNRIKN